jgi:hypothetical protein
MKWRSVCEYPLCAPLQRRLLALLPRHCRSSWIPDTASFLGGITIPALTNISWYRFIDFGGSLSPSFILLLFCIISTTVERSSDTCEVNNAVSVHPAVLWSTANNALINIECGFRTMSASGCLNVMGSEVVSWRCIYIMRLLNTVFCVVFFIIFQRSPRRLLVLFWIACYFFCLQ